MADGIELAKAYVQIVPSAEGIQGSITGLFGGEASAAGDNAGALLGRKMVSTLKSVLAAAGIGKIISESIDLGGALQQSIGGIETLFGAGGRSIEEYAQSVGKSVDAVKDEYASLMQSQQTVFDNAARAYKTVGLSANDYMEQTTSFAASLLSSVSHDTQAAAQLADMAMVDMADNANKMGTDMQDIQNAYQGFAKQNYTMLDNLKLGYGGTQAEMQRLLNDAEKISGVHYDLGNLADMYSAIHIIQTEMDITGTTAKEASSTLTGSFSAMKAAAENVLANWSTGADLTQPLAALVETAQTYLLDNLLPMISNVLAGIPEIVYTLIPIFLPAGTAMLTSLANGFAQGIPVFLATALPQLLQLTEQLRANAGQFVDAGLNLITQLLNGLIAGLPQLIAYAPDIIINLAGIINDNMPKILAQGVSIIVQLIAGIVQAVPSLLANWKKIFQAVLSVISAINWLNIGSNILKSIGNGVRNMGSGLLNAFKGGFSSALNWIKSLPSQAVQWGKNLIQSFINGLTGKGSVAGNLATAATAGFSLAETASSDDVDWSSVWSDANADIADSAQTMADITIPAYTKSGDAAASAAKKASTAAASVVNSYSDTAVECANGMTTTTEIINEELSNGQKQQRKVITETGRQLVNGVLKNVKTVTTIAADGKKSIQQTMETVRDVVSTTTSTTDAVVEGVQTSTQTVTQLLADGTEQQKQIITQTQTEIIEGALRTVKSVTTIAEDGTESTTKTVEKAASDTFSGLLQKWKKEASNGVLGTFSTLITAVKKQDWQGIGEWVLSTLYNGLAPENKKIIDDLGTKFIQQINEILADKTGQLSQKAWDIGSSIADGIVKGLGDSLNKDGGLQQALGNLNIDVSDLGSQITGMLGTIGTSMGSLLVTAGGDIAGMSQLFGGLSGMVEGLGSIFTSLGGLIMANPEIAAIIAIVAGVAALGIALFSKFGKSSDGGSAVSHYESPFAGNDVYDSLAEFSTRAAMQYRYMEQPFGASEQLALLQQIRDMLDEHLPDIGKGEISMDGEKLGDMLVPRMATQMDAQMGVVVLRAERGV